MCLCVCVPLFSFKTLQSSAKVSETAARDVDCLQTVFPLNTQLCFASSAKIFVCVCVCVCVCLH